MIRTLQWAMILVISASSSYGIDVEMSSRVNNLHWNSTREDTATGHSFDGTDWFWTIQGSVTQELSDGLLFKGGVENDPILRWRAYSQLSYTLDNLTLRFTPFLGAFNSTQKWFNPGLEALIEYTWPGLLFARGGFLTTFAPVSKVGDYYLSSQSAAVGFTMDNGIVSFNIDDREATFRTKDSLTTVDSSTKYWLDTEMFLKNVPLRWAILTGLQITNRKYVAATETSTPVYSAILGARLAWDFGAGTQAYTQVESAVFNVGWDSTKMTLPATATVLDIVAGMRYHW